MPGGRVEMGESSGEAVRREIQEELNSDSQIERLVWIVETFFVANSMRFHEVGLYYLITLPTETRVLGEAEPQVFHESAGTDLEMRWFGIADLASIDLRPAFLRESLKHLPEATQLIVVHD